MARSRKKKNTQAAGQKSSVSKKPTICLAMIVKDEEKDIVRCLTSVKDHIDYWVIFDTGSSDSTIEVIQNFMDDAGVKGELHQSDWKDFSTNRNEVLEVADSKADFTLLMDADDHIKVDGNLHNMIGYGHHLYSCKFVINNYMTYDRPMLFRNGMGFRYEGVLHEYLKKPENVEVNHAKLIAVVMNANSSPLKRAATEKEKYANDAKVLLAEHQRNPDNPRTVFYLAQSYRDAGMYKESEEYYRKRAEMNGWVEEVYYSKLMVPHVKSLAGESSMDEIMDLYLDAWEYRPWRMEAIHNVVKYHRLAKRFRTAYSLSAAAMAYYSKFGGKDSLFVAQDLENYVMIDEYCVSAFYCGEVDVAYVNIKMLMESKNWANIPTHDKERITNNMKYFEEAYNKKLAEAKANS